MENQVDVDYVTFIDRQFTLANGNIDLLAMSRTIDAESFRRYTDASRAIRAEKATAK